MFTLPALCSILCSRHVSVCRFLASRFFWIVFTCILTVSWTLLHWCILLSCLRKKWTSRRCPRWWNLPCREQRSFTAKFVSVVKLILHVAVLSPTDYCNQYWPTAEPLNGSQGGRLMALRCDRIGLWLRELLRFPRRLLVCIIIRCIDCVSLGLGATDGRSLEGEHRSGPPACIGPWCFSGLAARGRDVMSMVGMMKGRKDFMRAFNDRKLRVLIRSIK